MKRFVSILLAVMMVMSTVSYAAPRPAATVGSDAVEERNAQYFSDEIEQAEAFFELASEVSEDETYKLNIILISAKSHDALENVRADLESMGISHIIPLFTEDGEAVGIGKNKEVWYKAYTANDAMTVVDSVMKLKGICHAEPDYIYTSDSKGLPKEFDVSRDWAIKDQLRPHKNGKDWFWWTEEFGHEYAPGLGTVVAVIDTGVDYTHEDLAANMWVNTAELYGTPGVDDDFNGYIDDIYGANTTATGKKAGDPMDDHGHGTHVAGIIAMSPNGEGGVGLAYGAKIMAVKAGQSTGSLASSDIAEAIKYAHMMGADVINMSFGGTSKSYLVETALEDAFTDCVLVASAGNDGIPTADADPAFYPKRADIYPAGYSYVIGVMATDKNGSLASFSNWDYFPNANAEYEMTAPGVDIYSALPGNRYAKWSGTSMAAPFVAATAAILRSHYQDKDMYSSRFIMGQLSSATTSTTTFVDKVVRTYPALNAYDSIYYLPKPNITVKDTFLMDNVTEGTVNDGDSIIDVGEVVDLGILVRNQWGQTGEITVKADAVSSGGVANPFVEFITDEITLQSAGTFSEVNNGFVYDDSLLTAVSNPIRFKIAEDTPNDTQICINITVTTTNGYDEDDDNIYTAEDEYIFRVQAGRGISGTLTEDMTLTNDYLWIIENSLLIPKGITLTIEPGTKVQFYSSDYENACGGLAVAKIVSDGTLNAIGTEDEPIEMFPGSGFEKYCVEIGGIGNETLKYCNIVNPKFGNNNAYAGSEQSKKSNAVNLIDHCNFTQNYETVYTRYLDGGKVSSTDYFQLHINKMINSVLKNIKAGSKSRQIYAQTVENCLHESCNIMYTQYFVQYHVKGVNNLYMPGSNGYSSKIIDLERPLLNNTIKLEKVYSSAEAGSKYVSVTVEKVESNTDKDINEMCRVLAMSLGGDLAIINNDEEMKIFKTLKLRGVVGAKFNPGTARYEWIDGSNYIIDTSTISSRIDVSCSYVIVQSNGDFDITNHMSHPVILEIPYDVTDEEINEAILNFDYYENMEEYYKSIFTNNAILNPLLNNNPDTWSALIAKTYDPQSGSHYVANNYWGTENKTLINMMITDADDFPGTYQDIVEDPILTLESESLQDIYPFVTKVYLTDDEGNIVSNVQPGTEYDVHVHFNRDMDTATQPSVTYGPAAPYTDYKVDGGFVSPREWVGKTKISPILTDGTMYFRTKGGCAADDHWLVCGEDILRFSFNVSSNGVLAMLLNAEGGANKVELSWAQNDYETLAGYNLYRSTKESGNFTKINISLISESEYTDTDVDPGVTYYYYFKVVNTDGLEEASVSNTASAAPLDNIFPVMKHTPVASVKAGSQITVAATVTDNIAVKEVNLYYKKATETSFTKKTMPESATANLYVASIPANVVTADGVEYYVTASDADGNISYSGTAQLPNVVFVNSMPYISGITPSKIAISGGKTVTILGGNFTEDMTVKVGGVEVEEASFLDSGMITFVAPAKASGTYAVTLTKQDGTVTTSPTALSYTDASSIAQIPTNMNMVSGTPYTIPLHISASGDIISLHAEIDIPTADFANVKVEKVDDDANFQLDYSYSGGVLKIGCMGTSDIKTTDGALLNIVVTPKVTEEKQRDIVLHDVSFNGVEITNVICGIAILKPSYNIEATVKYYAGNNAAVEAVEVMADGVKAVTDGEGKASLVVATKNVVVTVSKLTSANAVTAFDASLVLQSAVDKITLNENQLLAADVDGNGTVNEYDAALILQKAVRKIDSFPCGKSWIFVPAYIEKTLSATSTNNVSFTAISVGDVDGSFAGE